jgi:hypothetical protein
VLQQPLADRRGLAVGVVVQDQVKVQVFGHDGVDKLEEPQELLVAVPPVVLGRGPSRWPGRRRRTGWWCRCGRSRGSSAPVSWAAWAGTAPCGPGPGSAISRPRTGPGRSPAGSCSAGPHRPAPAAPSRSAARCRPAASGGTARTLTLTGHTRAARPATASRCGPTTGSRRSASVWSSHRLARLLPPRQQRLQHRPLCIGQVKTAGHEYGRHEVSR